ncbi:MAG: L,D-transpeptidase family protein [Azospirillaceae bacterium]
MLRLAVSLGAAAMTLAAVTPVFGETSGQFEERTLSAALEQAFDNGLVTVIVPDVRLDVDMLRELYAARDFAPLWAAQDDFEADVDALLAVLENADDEGLRPFDYFSHELAGLMQDRTLSGRVATDLLLSQAVSRFASDVHRGRFEPRQLSRDFDFDRRPMALPDVVLEVARAGDPGQRLLDYAPDHAGYVEARDILAELRGVAEDGGWPTVTNHGTVRPGESSPMIPELRERLRATGELVDAELTPDADPLVYDDTLVAAVELYQENRGLAVDGVIGPQTYASLNVTVEERIDQVIATMERWRWMPADLGDRYLMVNIPDYELELFDGGNLVRRMDVIVGRADRQTPLFSSALTYLEFNPTWTVPTSIAVNDFLPRLLEDPTYLQQQNIRLYSDWSPGRVEVPSQFVDWHSVGNGIRSFMLRQDPGPGNSLGRVKFMMANNFSVYLHDTPARSLFYRATRSFSSGCVRLEDPMWLADFLLADTANWSAARREGILASGQTTRVNLVTPMPLHMAYITAWRDDTGVMQLREDVYGLDRMIAGVIADIRPERVEIALAN